MDDSSSSSEDSRSSQVEYVIKSRSSRTAPPHRSRSRAKPKFYTRDITSPAPAEDPSDAEINAEVTDGGWRCHLKRMVKRVDRHGSTEEYIDARRRHETPRTLSEGFSSLGEPQNVVKESEKADLPAEPEVVSDPEQPREVESIYHLYRVVREHDDYRGTQPLYATYSDSDDEQRGPEFHLEIKSPLVVKLLRNIVVYYPSQELDGSTITIPEPYTLLWHHHRALRSFLDDPSSDEVTKKHLHVLIEFLDSNEADATEFKNFDAAQKGTGTMSFRNGWYLFRPGSRLLQLTPSRSLSLSSLSVVESVKPAKKVPDSSTPRFANMVLRSREVCYDGTAFCWDIITNFVSPRDWSANVSELMILPIEHLVDQEEISRLLCERGLKYWQMKGQHLKECVGNMPKDAPDESHRVMVDGYTYRRKYGSGPWRFKRERRGSDASGSNAAVFNHGGQSQDARETREITVQRNDMNENYGNGADRDTARDPAVEFVHVPYKSGSEFHTFTLFPIPKIVDPGSGHLVRHENVSIGEKQGYYYKFNNIDPNSEPDNLILMLCQHTVWAFSFRGKQWNQYHVDDLEEVDYRKKSFDRLVLNVEYKAILKAMVAHHVSQGQSRFKDLVAGKGQGLVILLHGPPGVGKTLTAECIADLYERPLYSVTSGDVGVDPDTVEERLRDIFDYAVTWNAVLLLDEADVFLAERNLENLKRNALVSVFLRNLEYFNGVFFLTTNRVGTIDEAFQSRLHVTLGIEPLSTNDRREVWYNFIKDLKQLSKDERRVLAREARDEWCYKDLNGRQIRNCVKTALVLARQEGVPIGMKHFQTVIKIGINFSSYMHRLKKMNHERLAESMGTRLDLTSSTTTAAGGSSKMPRVSHTDRNRSKRLKPSIGGLQGSGPSSQAQVQQWQEEGAMGEGEEDGGEESDLGSDI